MAILSATQLPARKTRIMYHAQLNHRQVTRYLAHLVASGLVRKHAERGVFMLTAKGRRYRSEYAEYRRLNKSLTDEKATFDARKAALRQLARAM